MKLKGSEIIVKCLLEQDVDTIFGYPGGAVLNIYDALYDYRDSINHILTSHEQGAAHAADGYARATGKVGVVIATSGPGATNLVTGIATAYMDSVPMVAFTGQVPTALLGKDSFQEVDIAGVTAPVTKHNYIVKDIKDLAQTIREAFAIARTGRPGPVLIDVCKDVTAKEFEYDSNENFDDKRIQKLQIHKDCCKEDIINAANLINEAKKPFVFAGGGVTISGANELIEKLSNKAKIPVATTLMGVSSFSSTNDLFTGLVGMHGNVTSNKAVSHTDLLIAIGARFSDRVISDVSKFAPNAKIMHIDIDPAEINKNVNCDIDLIGDISYILKEMIEHIEEKANGAWQEQIMTWKTKYPLKYKKDEVLRPQAIIEKFSEMTNNEAIITTEVGQNQLWAAQYYKYTMKRQFISSGGLGTMGYGLGACIGAKVGQMDRTVINFAGDGSFRMNLNEIATAVEYKLPIIIAILNNQVLGMVRQWQNLFYDKRFSETTIDRATDFVKLAEAFGAIGIRVTKNEEIEPAIKKALSSKDKPVLIDFVIDKDEMVYPIVPPGAPISDVIAE